MRLLIAVEADMAHLRHGYQGPEALDHAQAGPQDGDNGQFAAGDDLGLRLADGGFDFNLFQREVAGHFVAHQQRDFLQQFPEILGSGDFVPHDRQLVLDHGVVDDMHLAHIGEVCVCTYKCTLFSVYLSI